MFTRAEHTTKRANIVWGDKFKLLIPKEFGGGFIVDTYGLHGRFLGEEPKVDLYGIIAYWNTEHTEPLRTVAEILETGFAQLEHDIRKGMDLYRSMDSVDKLRFPLKLVSVSYKGTYEDCKGRSYAPSSKDRTYFFSDKGFWDRGSYAEQQYYGEVLNRILAAEGTEKNPISLSRKMAQPSDERIL